MPPDKTGQPTIDDLAAKGFKISSDKAPDDTGKTEPKPPDKPGDEAGKYEGKSDAELRKILAEQEKRMGEMSTRIDEFKGNAEYWRNKADAIDRERQVYAHRAFERTQVPPDKPDQQAPQFNWEKPVESVDSVVQKRLEERDRVSNQRKIVEVQEAAKMAFQDGFKRAVRENPRLFESDAFQNEVVDFMYNFYSPYANSGVPVDRYVGNPDIWKKVAQNKRLENNQFDHLQPEKIDPVSPTATNIPAGGKLVGAEDEPVHFSNPAKEAIEFFKTRGYIKGEEEAAELVRDARKDRVGKE